MTTIPHDATRFTGPFQWSKRSIAAYYEKYQGTNVVTINTPGPIGLTSTEALALSNQIRNAARKVDAADQLRNRFAVRRITNRSDSYSVVDTNTSEIVASFKGRNAQAHATSHAEDLNEENAR
jgi:hypothetical protein